MIIVKNIKQQIVISSQNSRSYSWQLAIWLVLAISPNLALFGLAFSKFISTLVTSSPSPGISLSELKSMLISMSPVLKSLHALLVGASIIGIALAFANRLFIAMLMFFPFTILSPFEIFYIAFFGRTSDVHLFSILSEATGGEAIGFIGASAMAGFTLLEGLLAIYLIRILLIAKKQKWHMTFLFRRRLLIISGGLLIALTGARYFMTNSINLVDGIAPTYSTSWTAILPKMTEALKDSLVESWPAGLPLRLADFISYRVELQRANVRLASFRFGAYQIDSPDEREIHVLVIGESSRPDRWQINGYYRPTTPRLAERRDIISFKNAMSGWSWTNMSIPVIVTRKPLSSTEMLFQERSFIQAFREAGFKTYWLSTQSPLGKNDSTTAVYAREADETYWLNPTDYEGSGVYDEILLEPFDRILARSEPRVLLILHTLGSHYNYSKRYPDNYDYFRPSLKQRPASSLRDYSAKAEMNNSYDNSILYTDYLLSEIIARLQKISALTTLFYIADHGENLFDDTCKLSGHGYGTEHDLRVAALWWNSHQYTNHWPDKSSHIRHLLDAPISTSNVFYTMIDAANIRFPGLDLSMSLLHENWKPHVRQTHSGVDFDKAKRLPPCQVLAVH